ncbi:MAG: Hsp33 family molecular chaperone HslO [Alphaproteobacteria bacterium]|nr:Hsp33 family molecular chaperone HslO [Alphaproteobacteria bacterium]
MSGRVGAFVRGLAHDRSVRVLAVVADGPADEVARRHELSPDAARLAAEALVASVLLASTIKGDERILVQAQGTSPRFAFTAEVDAEGGVRARLSPATLPPVTRLEGHLAVIKWDAKRELYRGMAAIDNGSFEGALQHYLTQSQQAQGRVRLGARVDAEGRVVMASGLLVERLPGDLEPDDFDSLVQPLIGAPLSEIMAHFAFGQLLGSPVEVLERRPLEHTCSCSLERVERTLLSLGAAEILSLAEEQGQAEVTCNFCSERYVVDRARLEALAQEAG